MDLASLGSSRVNTSAQRARTSAHSTGLLSMKMKLSNASPNSCDSDRILSDLLRQLMRHVAMWSRFKIMSFLSSNTASTSDSLFLLQRQTNIPCRLWLTMNSCRACLSLSIRIPCGPSSPQIPSHKVPSQSRRMTLCGGDRSLWTLRATMVPSAV